MCRFIYIAACLLLAVVPLAAQVTFTAVPPSASGITWTHDNAQTPQRYMPESIGPGGAWFDYDNDGWLDLYLVNSGPADFYAPPTQPKSALYRNNRDGAFTDVAQKAGVALPPTFGMGAAAADYNADGWPDLYVTGYGRSFLYRNNRDGTFTDVTAQAGVAAPGWATHATWFDFDQDGRLDLWVSQYVAYKNRETCFFPKINRNIYCSPRVFQPSPSYLFRNRGDGTFEDVSKSSGIAAAPGMAFGAVATDINHDGLTDLFVANDSRPNNLYVNRGNGKFEDVATNAGVALDEYGNARAGMGVDAADYDGDGRQDLFVANLSREFYALFRNQGELSFTDESAGEINKATHLLSGWGLKFMDYDNDADPDLLIANSHPDDLIELQTADLKFRQPLLLFENRGGKFKNVSRQAGAVFAENFAARGLSAGDYDNDGDLDALVMNNGAAPALLRNEGGNRNHWLGLQLVTTKSDVGAVITWQTSDGKTHTRQRNGGGGYLASHDPREILGAGPSATIDRVEIRWPGGAVSRIEKPKMNGYLKVKAN
jgi:hypothetical protein